MAITQIKTTGLADDAVTGAKIADDTVAEANMANDAISLAELKAGTDGQIITYDASGNPTAVGPGTDGQVLTSTGAGSPPAFETISIPAGVGGATGVDFNDGVKIRSGTDNDLEIYHNAGDSYIRNNGGYLSFGCTNNADIQIVTNNTERMRVASDGQVSITDGDLVIGTGGHGIDFSAETNTSVSGTTADSDENLNHYEYGTWTAAFGSGGSNTNTNCDYIRIGKFVMISGNISVDDISTNANITVTGCPFSCITRDFTGSLRGYGIGNPTINTNSYANNSVIGGGDVIEFGAAAPQGMGWEMVFHNDFNLANNNSLRWTLTYITDS